MSKILIQSFMSDFHGQCTKWALEQLGYQPKIWDLTNFPNDQEVSISVSNNASVNQGLSLDSEKYNLHQFDTIWLRRQPKFKVNKSLHEADQNFALHQCESHIGGVLRSLDTNKTLVVNPRDNAKAINLKIPQLILANRVGFTIPKTLFSNNEEDIRDFVKKTEKDVIFKPYHPNLWQSDDGTSISYTAKLTPENMDGLASIKYAPGIFQEYIAKAYEVRAVFMGHTNISLKLDSQNSVKENLVDWRVNQRALPRERIVLPQNVEALCLKFMKEAGIVFGSFDFIVTEKGDYVFLEINEQGQFLGYESPGAPLLQPFLEFLISADPEFKWQEKDDCLTVMDYAKTSEYKVQQAQQAIDNKEQSADFVSHE